MSRVQRKREEMEIVEGDYTLTPEHYGVDEAEFEHLSVVREQEAELDAPPWRIVRHRPGFGAEALYQDHRPCAD